MRIVGLTGGIGSGKSTVADMFQALGVPIVDTDAIAHQLSAAGQVGARAVARQFGADYLDSTGAIDRPKLRALVFHDTAAKSQLEAVLHPLIRAEAMRQLHAVPPECPYAILVVPLLFETGAYVDVIDRALVVDCPESVQISRVKSRSGLDDATIASIMAAQLPRKSRLARADDVVVNDGEITQLMENVKKLHEEYVQGHERK